MVKKKITAQETQEPIRVLAAVPACHSDHVKYREQIKQAIQANIDKNVDVEITLSICEDSDNNVDKTSVWNWNPVIAKFQALSDRAINEGFDYLWIVEADVVVPENALSRLLGDKADVVAAVVPYKFQNDEYWEQYGFAKGERPAGGHIYDGMACTGYFNPDKDGKPTFETTTLYVPKIKDKLLVGSPEHMIFNGTGCILIKKTVLEKMRWRWDNITCGFDMFFWQDAQRLGFNCVTDGYVICRHLGK
jgi:hypothetical protein